MFQKTLSEFDFFGSKSEDSPEITEAAMSRAAKSLLYAAGRLKLEIKLDEINDLLVKIEELGEIDYNAESWKFSKDTLTKIEGIGAKFLGIKDSRMFAVGKYVIRIARDGVDSLLEIGEDVKGWESVADSE